jgi:tRNA (Thr-GGU) A37 N-methylase
MLRQAIDTGDGQKAGNMTSDIQLRPIGRVRGGRSVIADDDWGDVQAAIDLDPSQFDENATLGLRDFSHADVIFYFDKVSPDEIESGARYPRGRTDWPLVGIFAQRGKNRPNRLGLCTCRLISISGLSITVKGLDAIDGTPVLDIKPVMKGFLPRGEVREPAWATQIMQRYW